MGPHRPLTPTSTCGDFGVFPAPMRAACAQVWLVSTSVRALRTLGRAMAACWGGGEAQEAACGGGKVAIPAILTRLPDPGHAVRLQDCKVSTFGRALHRLDQVQAAWRAAARHWWQFGVCCSRKAARFSPCCMVGDLVVSAHRILVFELIRPSLSVYTS
jgi:hypothetical protein